MAKASSKPLRSAGSVDRDLMERLQGAAASAGLTPTELLERLVDLWERTGPSVGALPLLGEVREQILSIAARHGAMNIRVFGSVARGEATAASDVDLLVDLEPGRSLLDLSALRLDLCDLLGRDVDVVTTASLHPAIRDQVLAEAVAL